MDTMDTLHDGAREVVQTLRAAGYEAYLVGGCVRDALLGKQPKDYDIVSSATPQRVFETFPHLGASLIGAHFGVAQLRYRDGRTYEVATFRTDGEYRDGRRPEDVSYALTAAEDVKRRDFTVNALLQDPITGEVIDLVGGQQDIKDGIIRTVGEPLQRFQEDHLRMLRAIRFASRFGWTIEHATMAAIRSLSHLISRVSIERVIAEVHPVFLSDTTGDHVQTLVETGLLASIIVDVAGPRSWGSFLSSFKRLKSFVRPSTGASFVGPDDMLGVCWSLVEMHGRPIDFDRLKLTNRVLSVIEFLRQKSSLLLYPERHHPAYQRRFALDKGKFSTAMALLFALGDGSVARQAMDHWSDLVRDLKAEGIMDLQRPMVGGNDLLALGFKPGPIIKEVLDYIDDRVVMGELRDKESAVAYAKTFVVQQEPGLR